MKLYFVISQLYNIHIIRIINIYMYEFFKQYLTLIMIIYIEDFRHHDIVIEK